MTRRELYFDSARLHTLQLALCVKLDDLLTKLGVGLQSGRRYYVGPCPIHGGDNPGAVNLYTDGYIIPGYWVCRTHGCHRHFAKNILGFVRGVLSRQRYDWAPSKSEQGKKVVGFKETVDWCCSFLGKNLADIEVDRDAAEKRGYSMGMASLTARPKGNGRGATRGQVRSRLILPAPYFLRRGWPQDVLDRYDVGECHNPGTPFFNRVVVPIYDNEYRYAVGYTARSVFEACGGCGLWHDPSLACPAQDQEHLCSKWVNSSGFSRESHLFNYWFARKYIQKSGVVCLCEGPGDVLTLESAGIKVGVAMFGTELADQQQVLLELSGAMKVVVLTNMDEPGREAASRIKGRLRRTFRVFTPEIPAKDLGEMAADAVSEHLRPILRGL